MTTCWKACQALPRLFRPGRRMARPPSDADASTDDDDDDVDDDDDDDDADPPRRNPAAPPAPLMRAVYGDQGAS